MRRPQFHHAQTKCPDRTVAQVMGFDHDLAAQAKVSDRDHAAQVKGCVGLRIGHDHKGIVLDQVKVCVALASSLQGQMLAIHICFASLYCQPRSAKACGHETMPQRMRERWAATLTELVDGKPVEMAAWSDLPMARVMKVGTFQWRRLLRHSATSSSLLFSRLRAS